MLTVLRLVLLLGVILGVVLPKSSAALAQLGLVDDRVVVICTGHGMQTITLSDDDRPLPPQVHDAPCLLVAPSDGAAPVAPPVWVALAGGPARPAGRDLWRAADAPGPGHARAPPLA
ncbi:hypothetical protein [Paracoccus sp. ME4]|uniref:hypothetical protein n=1 Tax=Paracoccus sp. ME4 TaxID=3138066 RepID=UPI00398AD1C3